MFKKIAAGVIILILLQAINFAIVKYFPEIVAENNYSSWGIRIPRVLILIASIICIALLIHLIITTKYKFLLMLLAAGGLSNVCDRLIYGYVVDYIDIDFLPIFNIADIVISLSAILLIVAIFSGSRRQPSAHR